MPVTATFTSTAAPEVTEATALEGEGHPWSLIHYGILIGNTGSSVGNRALEY